MTAIKKPLLMARELISGHVSPGDAVVDATAGNGYDTLFLAELVGDQGKVYSFDIQSEAISRTTSRLLNAHLLPRVRLICSGHEKLAFYIKEKVSAVMFNLGYLPGSDHRLVTRPETTLIALEASLEKLAPGGIVTLVLYSGHAGGKEEKKIIFDYCSKLDQNFYTVVFYGMINWTNHPPSLLAIEKRIHHKSHK